MQTLHQERELSPQGQSVEDHPGLRGLVGDQATAYAEEVRVLRQRVATLESALAAAKVSQTVVATPLRQMPPLTSIDFAPRPERFTVPTSEFIEQTTPAVVAVATAVQATLHPQSHTNQPTAPATTAPEPAAAATTAASAVGEAAEPVAEPGFARAWSAEEPTASFEERVAERAFFQASTIDEESRTWLLAQ